MCSRSYSLEKCSFHNQTKTENAVYIQCSFHNQTKRENAVHIQLGEQCNFILQHRNRFVLLCLWFHVSEKSKRIFFSCEWSEYCPKLLILLVFV